MSTLEISEYDRTSGFRVFLDVSDGKRPRVWTFRVLVVIEHALISASHVFRYRRCAEQRAA